MQAEEPSRTWSFFGGRKGKSFETSLSSPRGVTQADMKNIA
jgi:hypothetical protein